MTGRFLLAALAAFVVIFVLGYLFHQVLLGGDYASLPGVYRSAVDPGLFVLIIVGQVVIALAMVGLYSFGVQDKPWLGQGVRFGLLVACVGPVPIYLIGYVVTNIPAALAAKQVIFEAIMFTAMGVAVAAVYRR